MKKIIRIRIPLPKGMRVEKKVERVKKVNKKEKQVEKVNKSRRNFLKRLLLMVGGAAIAGIGIKTGIDHQAKKLDEENFTSTRFIKKPEYLHLKPLAALVENAIQSILKNPSYNRIAFERTAWFYDLILKHASLNQIDPFLLYALVAQESRGAVNAESKAGAKGLTQFMPETSANYGLYPIKQLVSIKKISNKKIPVYSTIGDERLDPDKAIGAAAKHLNELISYYAQRGYLSEKQREAEFKVRGYDKYAVFFALAAYNAGYNKVDDAIAKTIEAGKLVTWQTISEYLPQETREYVPFILAKKIILENRKHFSSKHQLYIKNEAFGAYTKLLNLTETKKIKKTSIKTFAQKHHFDEEHLQLLNPHLKTDVWLKEADLRVPKKNKKEFEDFLKIFENFKNLDWDNFGYSEPEKNQPKICEHITHKIILKSFINLFPRRMLDLKDLKIKLKKLL